MRAIGRDKDYLCMASSYAVIKSGCSKVQVGCVIVNSRGVIVSLGANKAIPNLCCTKGCLRKELYGNNDKTHRNPED